MSNLLRDLMHILNEDEAPKSTFGAPVKKPEVTRENPESAEPLVKDGEVIDEADEYEDSGEFTEDFYSLSAKLKEISAIVKTQKFKHWMEQTDLNFSSEVTPLAGQVEQDIDTLDASLKALEAAMEAAE